MTPDPSPLDDYDFESMLSKDGTGEVYRARHRDSGMAVAVRFFPPSVAGPDTLRAFDSEFATLKAIDHPNVVRVIDFRREPRPFLVTELVDGVSVWQRVERRGAYAEAEALRLIGPVCLGLECAHDRGRFHRNVRPDHVLITVTGAVKLGGFYLQNLTRAGRWWDTPHYMAPEQFRDSKTDVRSDIYSLGATLYAMVTGVVPLGGAQPLDCWMKKIRNEFPTPKELNPALSERVDWAIRRAMSAEPGQRPSSCREFLEDLTGQSRAAAGAPGVPVPPAAPAAPATSDVWYLVYRDENNQPHTVKGSTDGIRKALRDRLLGDPLGIAVSRTKNGPFLSLSSTPEFQDFV